MSGVGVDQAAELVSAAEVYAAAAAAGIVVVGCGARKLPYRAPAAGLYTGTYFRSCAITAAAIAPGRWFILSARYGLVAPSEELEPYDLTLGQPGAVNAGRISAQAGELGLRSPVTALCSVRYADLLARVFRDVRRPLAGLGIGQQRHVLARMRAAA